MTRILQAEFSFVTWPFSLKLLWAPLVDAIFSTRMGRRKTWLIPTQYLIGSSNITKVSVSIYLNFFFFRDFYAHSFKPHKSVARQ